MTGTKMLSAEKHHEGLAVSVSANDKVETILCEKLLVAVGRRPRTSGLGLEEVDIQTDRGAIVTDEHFQTTLAGVYAIGDCNGKFPMAHTASA